MRCRRLWCFLLEFVPARFLSLNLFRSLIVSCSFSQQNFCVTFCVGSQLQSRSIKIRCVMLALSLLWALLPDSVSNVHCVFCQYFEWLGCSRIVCLEPPVPDSVECSVSNETSIGIAISRPKASLSSYFISNYHVTYTSLIQGFPGYANETVPFSADTVLSHYSSATAGVTYIIYVRSFVSGAMSDDVSINCTSGALNIVFVKRDLIEHHITLHYIT